MVIGIIGESCTGKSTLTDKLNSLLDAEVYTGKDYLPLIVTNLPKQVKIP